MPRGECSVTMDREGGHNAITPITSESIRRVNDLSSAHWPTNGACRP